MNFWRHLRNQSRAHLFTQRKDGVWRSVCNKAVVTGKFLEQTEFPLFHTSKCKDCIPFEIRRSCDKLPKSKSSTASRE